MNSRSEENYLKTIYMLSDKDSELVSTTELANYLGMKAASATDMMKKLADKKLVDYVPYKGVQLTAKGKEEALRIIRKHRLWEVFLVEKLGFGWEEVHEVAEQLEHIKSPKLIDTLDVFLGTPKFDPHGDPIPDKNGVIPVQINKSIADMNINDIGVIVGVKEHASTFLNYLKENSLTLGSEVKVLQRYEFDQSFKIEVDQHELSLSFQVANAILVQSESDEQ